MKRTCNKCIALMQDGDTYCDLSFRHDDINCKPLEECPKPLTAEQFFKARIERREQLNKKALEE